MQRIRTFSEVEFEVVVSTEELPVYRQIAGRVSELKRLGMSNREIGRKLGFDSKTIQKSLTRVLSVRKMSDN